jgi:hypothetical protein
MYMFAGGYNQPGSNNYGRDYHWNAPVLPDGTRHATFERLSRMGAWIQGWESYIVDTVKEFDFYLALSTDLVYQARWMDQTNIISPASEDTFGYATVATQASHDAYDGVEGIIRVMTEFNANFQFLNLSYLPRNALQDRPIIVPSSGYLPRGAFDMLREHMENGQTVVLFPTVPRYDADGNRMEDFLEATGLSGMSEVHVPIPGDAPGRTRFLTVEVPGIGEVAVDRGVRTFDSYGQAEVLATYAGAPAVVKKRVGSGYLLLMGIYPSYLTRDSQEMFRGLLLDAAGVRRRLRTTKDRLHAVVRRRSNSDTLLLTIANIAGGEGTAKVDIDVNDKIRMTIPRRTSFVVDPKSIYSLWVNVDLNGLRLVYATTELCPQNDSLRRFTARGDRLGPVEFAFDQPVRLQWDGVWHESEVDGGVHLITTMHGGGESRVLLERGRTEK